MIEWKPIETAPDNGKYIVYHTHGHRFGWTQDNKPTHWAPVNLPSKEPIMVALW